MIEIKNLQLKYENESIPVLDGLDFSLKNEKVAIVGPNGSGKTSLFKTILGLVQVEKGDTNIFGVRTEDIKNNVGVSTNLIDVYKLIFLPVKDLIKIFAKIKRGNPQEAYELFNFFELNKIFNKKLHQLSMGQQKMFGNIMAICFSPKLVLLDEPFENVDQNRKLKYLKLLQDSNSELVLITHEFSFLQHFKDFFLYFLIDGKLWGKFKTSDIDRLYLNKGKKENALKILNTRFGQFSITLDRGGVAIKTTTNLNSLLDMI